MLHYLKSKLLMLLNLSVLVSQSTTHSTEQTDYDGPAKVYPSQHSSGVDHDTRSVIIVSTLDGKVSALDSKNGGALLWSIDIGQGPLVASSISKLQVKQDGKTIRLIPSLSGGLFQFDGKTVEAVPFTADHLLSSSFKVTDDSILVGGKDVTTFALDSQTGKILYFCSSAGCEIMEEALPGSDVIIVKRRQQTVRSVENRNGHENWNFTVGEVELDISKGISYELLEHSGEESLDSKQREHHRSTIHEVEDVDNKSHEGEKNEHNYASAFIGMIKVLVPEGVFYKFSGASKKNLEWKHKFESPIANAWYVNGGEHQRINLFDPDTVPALHEKNNDARDMIDPTIYMGFYKTNVYIQVSSITEEAVSKSLTPQTHGRSGLRFPYFGPVKFPYRPYLATSDHLTEALVGEANHGEIAVRATAESKGSCGNTLAVYTDKDRLHNDIGYYFKSDLSYQGSFRESRRKGRVTVDDIGNESFKNYPIDVVYSSFMHWWKEILIITITTSIFVQCLIVKIMGLKKDICEKSKSNSGDYVDAVEDMSPQTASTGTMFESRYLHDFEPIQCLGKGGFGVVFQSRNKVDDCSYAVKRICLPNKQAARDKVMREVRALAKLEHPCIVRYFNAWTEEPPTGWQEKLDQQLISDMSSHMPSSLSASNIDKDTNNVINSMEAEKRPRSQYQFSSTETSTVIRPSNVPYMDESGSFSIHFQDSCNDINKMTGTEKGDQHLGKFFQTSSSSEDSHRNIVTEDSVPFSRYKNDISDGIVFEADGDPIGFCGSTGDSAIVTDGSPGNCRNLKGHVRNVSDCADLPSFEEIYGNNGRSSVRRRVSYKKSSNDDSDTSGSELKSVVCRSDADIQKDARIKSIQPKLTSVYLYIQMQLCKKDSLRIWLAENSQREREYCLWIFQQVTSAVEYVHECNLIHRDLKPSNIFFSFDGSIKVGDFGLVTEMDDQLLIEQAAGSFNFPRTEYMTSADGSHTERVGTRLYMAPEQMTSRNYSQKVDIFALGLIFIELLTPFSTQMERIRELTQAREGRVTNDFMRNHPNETKLVKKMLSTAASMRPTANEVFSHEIFSDLESKAGFVRPNKSWNSNRTLSNQ